MCHDLNKMILLKIMCELCHSNHLINFKSCLAYKKLKLSNSQTLREPCHSSSQNLI